ncbi:hypothetical protein MKX03_003623 [Papaver bracteatum]|nr:hypothetical protein MKX03_003623 [Papaver bracteatum]
MDRGRLAGEGFNGGRRRREAAIEKESHPQPPPPQPPSSTTNSGGQFLLNLLPNQSQQPQKNPSFTSSNHTLHHHHHHPQQQLHNRQKHLDPAGPSIAYPPPWNLQSNGAIDPSSQLLPPPGFFPPNPPASSSSHFPGPEFPDELFGLGRSLACDIQKKDNGVTGLNGTRRGPPGFALKEDTCHVQFNHGAYADEITRQKQSNGHGGFQGDLQWLSGQIDHPGPPPGSNLHSVPASAIEASQVKLDQIEMRTIMALGSITIDMIRTP